MRRVCRDIVSISIHLIPRLRRKNIMHILNLVLLPDLWVHILPAQRLERVVDVRERHPAALEEVGEERLVREVHVDDGVGLHVREDQVVDGLGGVHNLEAAVHEAEGANGRVGAGVLGDVGGGVLGGEGAVFWDPMSDISPRLSPQALHWRNVRVGRNERTYQSAG